MDVEELGENHVSDAKGSTRRSEEQRRHPGSLDWPRGGEAGGHGPLFPRCRDPCMTVPMSYRTSSDGAGGARAGCEHEGGGGGADPGQIKRLLRCKEALKMGDQTFEEVPIPTSCGLCPGSAQAWEVAGRIDSAFQAVLSLHL